MTCPSLNLSGNTPALNDRLARWARDGAKILTHRLRTTVGIVSIGELLHFVELIMEATSSTDTGRNPLKKTKHFSERLENVELMLDNLAAMSLRILSSCFVWKNIKFKFPRWPPSTNSQIWNAILLRRNELREQMISTVNFQPYIAISINLIECCFSHKNLKFIRWRPLQSEI